MEQKINCEDIPTVFFLDKNAAKHYFRQYGRLKRIIFRPKFSSCSVDYATEAGALNALANAGDYEGKIFKVRRDSDGASKSRKRRSSRASNDSGVKPTKEATKSVPTKKDPDPDWLDDPDVKAELEAMGGLDYVPLKKYDLRPEAMQVDQPVQKQKTPSKTVKAAKLKRTWKSDTPKTPKKKKIGSTPKQLELIKVIKQPAMTLEDKFKILDARDKLIRLMTKKKERKKDAKSRPMVGKCPDMCPEKERILRQMQHQVALYEQEFGGRSMNPSLAVKQYSRSSADQESPLSHELRPVAVLQMTMGYLMHQIMSLGDTPNVNFAEWYHFLWDRTRGIRKDITQQELCSQGSVQLVEQCARFHILCSARLVAEDPAVFDQKINTENLTKCLQTLKYLYHDLLVKGESCPNEAEFRAYVILLNLNDGNFMWEVQQLRPEIQKSPEVQFALMIYSAIDKNNYVRFFKLVHSTTYLNACILMRYFVQIRTKAIKIFLKSFSPRIPHTLFPLAELTKILAFEDMDSTVEFLETYGLIVNTERTHVLLDRKNFKLPQYPYQLERAINIVESKRRCSIGETVCGSKLPPKDFEYHLPEESFDGKGCLILDGYLKEIDIKITPEELKTSEVVELGQDEVDRKAREEQEENLLLYSPVVSDSDSNDVFKKTVKESDELQRFDIDKGSFDVQELSQNSFANSKSILSESSVYNPDKSIKGSIFANVTPAKQYQISPKDSNEDSNSQSVKSTSDNIFGKVSEIVAAKPDNLIFGAKVSQASIFSTQIQTSSASFSAKSQTPLSITRSVTFNSKSHQGILKPDSQNEPRASVAPKPFQMPKQQSLAAQDTKSKIERLKQQELEKQAQLKREIEEAQKKLEFEKQKLLEQQQLLIQQKQEELARARREEEKWRLLEAERIKQQEILKKQQEHKRLELERRKLEERRENERQAKEAEIRETVKNLLAEVVNRVEEEVRKEKLALLAQRIRYRLVEKYAKMWYKNALRNKRKRKAIDCSPCWIYSKSVNEHAAELSMNSQDMTLRFIKRYRRGKPFELNPLEDDEIKKIDIHNLVHNQLITRLYEFDTILNRHLYWKVTISLPDSEELSNGLYRIETVLDKYIQWERRVNNTLFIEQVKVNLNQTVTYCIEKQQGIMETSNDSNGYIFVAKDFNKSLCNRIIESLRNFGVYVKVPIVILLQEYDGDKTELQKLIDEDIVSDYIIIVDNFSSNKLIHTVKESLVFLACKTEKPPTLEMDTLNSFLDKYLCNDVWKRVGSFSKWNAAYKKCLKDPNIVIHLYNECVSKLRAIILNKVYFEYADFPEVFKNFLLSDIPNSLPCDYRYFPNYWTDPSYIEHVSNIIEGLYLPKFSEKWPQDSEFELEVTISKYCTQAFRQPEKPFYKIMSVILTDIDPNVNFDDISNVNWVDIIEVLAAEKVGEIDFSLSKTKFGNQSVFNQVTIVYDPQILNDFKTTDWFYTNNPSIQDRIIINRDIIDHKVRNYVEPLNSVNVNYNLDKALSDLLYKESNKEKALKYEKDLENFKLLFNDLQRSIELGKKISNKFEHVLQTIIEED